MTMNKIVGSSLPFSREARSLLKRIAFLLIPESEEYELPGGDDDAIFAHFLKLASPQLTNINQCLFELQKKSNDQHGDSFLKLQMQIFSLMAKFVRVSESWILEWAIMLSLQ